MKDFFEFREGRVNELSAKLLDKAAKKADDESDKAHHAKDRGRAGKKYDQATKFHKGAKDSRRRAIRRGEKVTEDLLYENKYPMASKWMQGAKNVKGKGFEFVRGQYGVHTIKKNGKSVGDFSLERDSDLWVINLNGVRGQVTADSIDDIPKLISDKIKESVELGRDNELASMANDMNEKASHDEIMKDINDFLRNNDGSGVAGMSRRLEKKYGIGPAQARSMIKTALQKVKALPKTGPKKAGRFPHIKESSIDENQTKTHLKAKSKLLGGASMMDLERSGNNIRAYAKKSGGSDKKDFDTAADYVISLGRLTDANKVVAVLKDLTMHVGLLDTDVRDKIKSMLPTGLKKKV